MRVFVAGATGAIGPPLVTARIARGHTAAWLTRTPARAAAPHGSDVQRASAAPHVAEALVLERQT